MPNLDTWAGRALRANRDILAHHSLMTGMLYRAVDLIAALAAAFLSFLTLLARYPETTSLTLSYQLAVLICLLLVIIIFDRFELYLPWRGRSLFDQVGRLAFAWTTVFALMIAAAFVMKLSTNFSRQWVLTWFVLGFLTLGLARAALLYAL